MPGLLAIQDPAPDQDLVPVGTTAGYLLLQLLSLQGWQTFVQAAPTGVRVTARTDARTISRVGASVAEIAVDLFKACSSIDQGEPSRVSAPRGCG